MVGNKRLPPGFRFHPTNVELVMYYLKRKVLGKKLHYEAIAELDIYKYPPWDLPDKSLIRSGDLKWYFFCPRERKYSSGSRNNRSTAFGYWKTTGKDRPIHCKNEIVGMIKTLVFHRGKAPKGDRTDWVMYEYRLEEKYMLNAGVIQESYVLSSIFKKDGPGPRNGAQYGAPFNEEDWDNDDDVEMEMEMEEPVSQNQSVVTNVLSPEAISNSVPVVADSQLACLERLQGLDDNDDVVAMLENFTAESPSAPASNDVDEVDTRNNEAADGFDNIFKDLEELGNLGGHKHKCSISDFADFMEGIFGDGDGQYLEAVDLDVPLSYCSGGSHPS